MSSVPGIRMHPKAKYVGIILVFVVLLFVVVRFTIGSNGLSSDRRARRNSPATKTGTEMTSLIDTEQGAPWFDFHERQAEARTEGKYLLAYFFHEGDEHKWDEFLDNVHHEWRGKTDVTYVPMNSSRAAPLMKKYGLTISPSMLVFAPNGAVTAGFVDDPPSIQLMSAALVSKCMADVMASVQNRKFTFLVIGDNTDKTFRENSEVALAAARTLDGMAEVVSIDPRKDDASDLIDILGLGRSEQQIHTYVVSPAGGIVTQFEGRIAEENLFDSFAAVLSQQKGCGARTVTGGSSCEPGKGVAGSRGCGAKSGGSR